jgi:hypothetical protein
VPENWQQNTVSRKVPFTALNGGSNAPTKIKLKGNDMSKENKEFLQWIHDRMRFVHGENENYDYMNKLRAVIAAMPDVSPAIANKATEEGELPELPKIRCLIVGVYGYLTNDMRAYARQAIAADRTSRQVANKAEVERDAARYRWLRNPDTDVALVLDKQTSFVPPDERVAGVGGYHTYEYRAGEELDAAIDAARGIATPPATTGASTAREAWEYSFTHSSGIGHGNSHIGPCLTYDKAQAFGVGCFGQKSVFVSVGSSTVLTDERIGELYEEATSYALADDDYAGVRAFVRLIEREVAAQAGQVEVPEALEKAARLVENVVISRIDGPYTSGECAYELDRVAREIRALPIIALATTDDARDAARYRFLRKGFGEFGPDVDMHNAFVDGDEKMDAAIDAAIIAAAPSPAKESK